MEESTLFRKYFRFGILALVFLLVVTAITLVGVSNISATPGRTSACESCHSLGGGLSITTDTNSKTVAPGSSFTIGISWAGGAGNRVEINWPNVQSNTLFTPTPRVPFSASSTTGSTSSTLTAPATAGTYTVRVYAAMIGEYYSSKDMTITVAAPVTPVVITTTTLPAGTVGTAYSQTLAATSGSGTRVWAVSAGSLPAGLSLNSSSGLISGTPTTAATSNFTVSLTVGSASDTQALSITIAAAPTPTPTPTPVVITTTTLPAGTVGTAYSQTLAATSAAGNRTWAVSAGALPAGLTLNTSTGVISGTPTTATTANFTVSLTVGTASDIQALSILVNPAPVTPVVITTASLPAGTVGSAYSQTLAATSGSGTRVWAVSAGSLPAGLSLNSSSGLISGTPTTAATSNFTVSLTVGSASDTQALSILVNPAPSGDSLVINTGSLTDGRVNSTYSQKLSASGGSGSYTWSVSEGSLPTGLNLNSSTGTISGRPLRSGEFVLTIQVTDGPSVVTKEYNIDIASSSSGPSGSSDTDEYLSYGTDIPMAHSYYKLNSSGLISDSDIMLDETGLIQKGVLLSTLDGKLSIKIENGTRLLNLDGSSMLNISATLLSTPPAAPIGQSLIFGYTFGPDGANFNPDLTLTLKYDLASLPAGVSEKDLYIAYFDGIRWQKIDSDIDTNTKTLTTQLTHLSSYAILAKVTSPTASTLADPKLTPTVAPNTTAEVVPAPTSDLTTSSIPNSEKTVPVKSSNVVWFVIGGLILALIIVGSSLMLVKARRRTH
jgi:hypothetical protein